MINYADRLITAIRSKGNPCVIGLDPRLELIPEAFKKVAYSSGNEDIVRSVIRDFNETTLQIVSPLVPAVKLQIAFYEQYGLSGMGAFEDTIRAARDHGLIVMVDAKLNDISSTAKAYANAFLGRTNVFGEPKPIFDVDCITVSPFLGHDSLEPFIEACTEFGKGVFVLVKTSNPGSKDFQDRLLTESGELLYESIATLVHKCGVNLVGDLGYSSIGAVVGATFPSDAKRLRAMMPKSIFLVPGYGAQGGVAKDTIACFNDDGLGAVVNASRSITYSQTISNLSVEEYAEMVRLNTVTMIQDMKGVLTEKLTNGS